MITFLTKRSSRLLQVGLPMACLATGLGLVEAKSAHALTYTTPCIPYATYGNAQTNFSSSGTSNNLTFPQFNVPGGTLTSLKLLFSGPNCSGGAPIVNSPGVTYGLNSGTPPLPGSTTIGINNVKAQVQLFFGTTPLGTNPVGGPELSLPTSGSFVTTGGGTGFSTLTPTGAYGGNSTDITSAAVLAAFTGNGSISTSKFQTVWNADLSCSNSQLGNCLPFVGATFGVQLGSQINLFNPPSALVNDGYISIEYTYSVTSTPGPLPILGAGLAFGWAKRIRRKVASVV